MSVNPDLRLENREDVVIALLGTAADPLCGGGAVVGVTRMMKLLFLLEREGRISAALAPGESYFDFEPYDMGPFDAQVYDALEFLQDIKLVQATSASEASAGEEAVERERLARDIAYPGSEDFAYATASRYEPPKEFRLTKEGFEVAAHMLAHLAPDVRGVLERVKRTYGRMPLRDLLRYVYTNYPESAERSRIRHDLGLE